MVWHWWWMDRWSLKPKNRPKGGVPPPLGQSSEHPLATDAGLVADRQLGAIHKVESGVPDPVTMEQEVKGQQQPWHQGHKPAGGGN